jgi:hypothetical protein
MGLVKAEAVDVIKIRQEVTGLRGHRSLLNKCLVLGI